MDENGANPTQKIEVTILPSGEMPTAQQTIENISNTLNRLEETVGALTTQVAALDDRVKQSVTREEMESQMTMVQQANQTQINSVDTNVNDSLRGLADQIAQISRTARVNSEAQSRSFDNYTRDQAEVFSTFRRDLKTDMDGQWNRLQEKVEQALTATQRTADSQKERMDAHAERIATLERQDEERGKQYTEFREEQRQHRGLLGDLRAEISDFLIRIVPVTHAVMGDKDTGVMPLRAEFEFVRKQVDEIKWIGRGGVVTVLVLVISKLLGIDLGGVI